MGVVEKITDGGVAVESSRRHPRVRRSWIVRNQERSEVAQSSRRQEGDGDRKRVPAYESRDRLREDSIETQTTTPPLAVHAPTQSRQRDGGQIARGIDRKAPA